MNANDIREHMKVVGSDGQPVGTVDHLDGDSIKLAKNDPQANGEHHWVPQDWVESVGDDVRMSMPASEVTRQWRSSASRM